jgi:hypothetical protein
MKSSGLVSVGHLLATKSVDEYKLTFQHLGTILLCNLPEKYIHKIDGRWTFEQVCVDCELLKMEFELPRILINNFYMSFKA